MFAPPVKATSKETAPRPSRKLAVGRADDPAEHEADRWADEVTHAPNPGPAAERLTPTANALVMKRDAGAEAGPADAPPIVDDALARSGQPLDQATRAYFEPRFGHDFANVRIHSDDLAARSAKAIHARAFTVGRDVVFASGSYAPTTPSGRRLLAHELAHVVQQRGQANVIRRSEVDDRSCSGLNDIGSDVNSFVNQAIDGERKAMSPPLFGPMLAMRVMKNLGGRTAVSPIETFIESLPPTKRTIPPNNLAGTKYSGAGGVYSLQGLAGGHIVGSVAKVSGICIGADKLGHFFDQGWDFNEESKKPGGKPTDVTDMGLTMEMGPFGLGMASAGAAIGTGVFSNADIAANRAGMKFYKDLEKNPEKLRFHIGKYITSQWNEQVNPSFYESNLASSVWSNLLSGQWVGDFSSPAGGTRIKSKLDMIATASGTLTGTLTMSAKAAAGSTNTVSIKNGKITQKTVTLSTSGGVGPVISASPVSGVSIDFDWERGADSGKGRLESVNERTLTGTLGSGSSASGSGTFKLKKA